jgi:hypothetical protein
MPGHELHVCFLILLLLPLRKLKNGEKLVKLETLSKLLLTLCPGKVAVCWVCAPVSPGQAL